MLKADSTEQLPDHYWWNRLKEGEVQALEHLYRTHSASLLKFGYRICYDRDLVRDTIQDIFVELWEHRERRAEVRNSKFYLFRMLKSHLSKKLALRGRTLALDGLTDQLVDETIHAELAIVAEESDALRKQQLAAALQQLSPRQREAILLRFYENFSYDEIADLMAISYQGVVNLVHKATVTLRHHLLFEWTTLLGAGLSYAIWLEKNWLSVPILLLLYSLTGLFLE